MAKLRILLLVTRRVVQLRKWQTLFNCLCISFKLRRNTEIGKYQNFMPILNSPENINVNIMVNAMSNCQITDN